MRATLFGLPASHPTLAGQLMLEHKGVDYRRIDFPAGMQRLMLRPLGFPGKTVPAVRIEGARLQGTTEIALALDALLPERPLFPADPERHLRAAELLAPSGPVTDEPAERLPAALIALMRDIGIPNGVGAVGYDAGDIDTLVAGTLKQQRLLATAPREASEEDIADIFRRSLSLWS